ncbi:MAG: hypothetical protein J6A15_02105 [Clostridia bacterium]|nr:hypothetical protein [Clostridia bacterium]
MANIYGPGINYSSYHCKTCPFLNMGDRKNSKCYCEKNRYYVDPDSYCSEHPDIERDKRERERQIEMERARKNRR